MKKIGILAVFLSVFSSVFAKDCYCGTVQGDPHFARAVFLLDSSIRHVVFHLECGFHFPRVASEYYPPIASRLGHDDHYLYDGVILWDPIKYCYLNKDKIVKEKDSYSIFSFDNIRIPIRIGRHVRWYDHPNRDEKNLFIFQENYGVLAQAFRLLRDDIMLNYQTSEQFLRERIQDLANKIPVYERVVITDRLISKDKLLERKQRLQFSFNEDIHFLDQKEAEAYAECATSLELCILKHKNPLAHFNRGLFYYLEGHDIEALDQIDAALQKLKDEDLENLQESALLLKGQTELEAGLYADAVLTLTELVRKNPQNKEAYFERAIAYFETGEFDLALSDYLKSEVKNTEDKSAFFSIDYASGLVDGIKKGLQDELGDTLPAWAPMMGFGLWTTLSNVPIPSVKFVTASLSCVAAAGIYLVADQMVSELKELVTNWDELSQHERGELTGYLIGKYGTNVFASAGSVKLIVATRNLTRANHLLTFELAQLDQANLTYLKTKYKKIEKFNKDQAHIQKTFGRSSHPEQKIRETLETMGYRVCKRPEGIPENCLTRFSEKGCGLIYQDPVKPTYNYDRLMPGKPHSPNPKQQQPYITQVRNGHFLNAKGEKVLRESPEAHISPDEFVFRSWNYKPE